MPHDEEIDTVFTDTDMKALLLKSMPPTDNFCKRLSYFVQFQNITGTQGISKSFAISRNLEIRKQHKYI